MALGGRILTWFEGRWHDGNLPIMGAADHGTWQGTLVFDGARAFEDVTPDLGLHCARLIRSAEAMGLAPILSAAEIAEVIREGVSRFAPNEALYLRPMMWSREGSKAIIDAEPTSSALAICLEVLPMPEPGAYSLCVSPWRRPTPEVAVTEAKAGCLYPNNARIVRDARARGFNNALSLDFEGNVAETASSNVFLVRDGVARTPVPNGCFLAGITRRRIMALLHEDGIEVEEAKLTVEDFRAADEIFLTGNAFKTMPVTRFEDRDLAYGPVAKRARQLYWDFAHDLTLSLV